MIMMNIVMFDEYSNQVGNAILPLIPRVGDYLESNSSQECIVLKVVWNYKQNHNTVKLIVRGC